MLNNYYKYLDIWDNYEQQIDQHFREKDIIKHGSEGKANRMAALHVKRLIGVTPSRQL